MHQYFRNWWLFLHVRRLWTRDATEIPNLQRDDATHWIAYKRGWTPLRFLPVYLTSYLLAVLLGRGVQSLSRAFRLLGKDHWGHTGELLWGSRDLWK